MVSAGIQIIPDRTKFGFRHTNIAGGMVIALVLVLACLVTSARAQTATEQTLVTTTAAGLNGVILASDGNFYGASFPSGSDDGGIYKITSAGAATELYAFTTASGYDNTALTEGSDGKLYGMTTNGGANGAGTIFQLTLAGQLTVLHNFSTNVDGSGGDGDGGSAAPLVEGTDGNFYGTASQGGSGGGGTIFKITPAGDFSVLYSFTGSGTNFPQGSEPFGLVQGSDGNFYGTTVNGGANNNGAFFKITSSGDFTLLYSFTGAAFGSGELDAPAGPLVEASTGNFYGMTQYDVMFKLTPAGDLTPLYAAVDNDLVTDGLTLASDGNLYAAITLGDNADGDNCPDGCGTVFQLTPSGNFATIYNFTDDADSGFPVGLLIQGSDGKLYVTTTGTSLGISFGGAPASPVVSGTVDSLALSPALPAPVQLSFSSGKDTVDPGSPVTLSWKVLNAFSTTMQQCAAFVQGGTAGAGTWTGLQTGKLANTVYSGSATITPTAEGTYTYALTCGGQESGFATLSVGNGLSVTTATLPGATVGKAYSQTLAATGGTAPYTWDINSGSLPDGLSLDASTGAISGKPLQSGTENLVVQVTDSADGTATAKLSLTVQSGLSITSSTLSQGTVGTAYNETLAATGGIAPYTWSVVSGSLPAGLSLASETGIISGTPTTAGTSNFSVKVADAEGTPATATGSVSLKIAAAVAPGFTTTAGNNGNVTIAGGSTGTVTLTTTATGGYTGTVNYSCSPSSATFTCSVAPTSVSFTSGGATTQTATLTINAFLTTSSDLKQPAQPFQGSSIPIYSAMALWLPGSFLSFFGLRGKGHGKHLRRLMMLVLLCAGLASAASLTGCGTIQKDINCAENGSASCSNNTNTPAGSYTVAVTSSDGTTQTTTTVNVTVQ